MNRIPSSLNWLYRKKSDEAGGGGGGTGSEHAINGETKPIRQNRIVVPNITVAADVRRAAAAAAAAIISPSQQPVPVPVMINPNESYANNSIHTSKYNWITFLPKNLFEQFYRSANLYFLFIQILNWLPGMEVFVREVQLLPLLFVLSVTAIKDLFEDRRRHMSDKRVNNMNCLRYDVQSKRFVRAKWKDLLVGDLVSLTCNEIVPADILLLRCRSPEGEPDSVCFVETSNLDGENNLKARYVVSDFRPSSSTASSSSSAVAAAAAASTTTSSVERKKEEDDGEINEADFDFEVDCEKPSMKLHKFQGTLIYRNQQSQQQQPKRVAINKDNLLLRDCILKNTSSVQGLVIYAGHETKALLNNKGPRHKRSRLEKMMNRDIIMCVVILLIMSIIGFMGRYFWLDQFNRINHVHVPYTDDPSPVETLAFTWPLKHFATFLILYQMIIPISLYVCIEMVKLGQIYMINRDEEMLDPITNRRCECRAWNITEDLGQIEYVFCDKTGTLTENMMEFQCCCIRGIDYYHPGTGAGSGTGPSGGSSIGTGIGGAGQDQTPEMEASRLTYIQSVITQKNKELRPNPVLAEKLETLAGKYAAWKRQDSNVQLSDEELAIHHFFIVLAICNTATNKLARAEAIEEGHRKSSKMHAAAAANFASTSTKSINNKKTAAMGSGTAAAAGTSTRSKKTATGETIKTSQKSRSKSGYSFFGMLPRGIIRSRASNPVVASATAAASASSATASSSKRKLKPEQAINIGKLRNNFESESPDEVALVTAAFACKYRLMKRGRDNVDVKLPDDSTVTYRLLGVLPFDSNRKRMSVIVECPFTKKIILYTKGSDQTVFEKLNPEFNESGSAKKEEVEATKRNLLNYSNKGLRVLCMAKRELPEQEFKEWSKMLAEAEVSDKRERALLRCYNQLESNLELLGATAIEDKLQYRVPEIIASLRKAGISVWVLTGDKMETAVSIAKACSLFSPDMNVIKISLANVKSKKTAKQELIRKLEYVRSQTPVMTPMAATATATESATGWREYLKKWYDFLNQEKPAAPSGGGVEPRQQASRSRRSTMSRNRVRGRSSSNIPAAAKKWALVIDGPSLNFVLQKESLNHFITLTKYCGSVLCCRVSPLQKSHVVKCVKNKMNVLTMAVGDGANDVAMIQTANIGVGVMGVEGTQAAMASDFSIPKFHYLERLILLHGNLCYYRLALCILYFFYKNTLVVFVLFFYQFICGFSGGSLLDDVYLMAVNIFYTTFPAIIRGILDKDTDERAYLQYPALYVRGRTSQAYTYRSFWVNTTDSIYQSLVIFFLCYGLLDAGTPLHQFGLIVFIVIIVTNLLQIMIETKYWNRYFVTSIFISLGFFISSALFLDFNYSDTLIRVYGGHNYKVLVNTMRNPEFYHCLMVIPVLCVMPRFVLRTLQEIIKPQFRLPDEAGNAGAGGNSVVMTQNHQHHQQQQQQQQRQRQESISQLSNISRRGAFVSRHRSNN